MLYVLQGQTIWSVHRSSQKATAVCDRLVAKWARKGYEFRVQRLRHRWAIGDNPYARYYVAEGGSGC